VTNIGLINEYKVKIYKENYKNIGSERKINGVSFFTPVIQKHLRDTATFISYLNYFKEDIINQDLTSEQLNKIRKYLGFNYDSQKDRDIAMRDLFIELTPDICAICGIRETYERNRDRKQHFDVHHVISLNNNKQLLDVMDNLVKLCPTHHSMMKKSHGLYAHQLKSNLIILKNYKNVYSFAAAYFNEKNINLLAEKITKLLK
jgi:5-methylcytosine-specific restriction protein A